jgi:hypothetical protein
MRIALSAKRLSVYIRVQKGNSNTIEALAKVFFCGSTSSPRTEKLNNFNLSPFTLSLSKGKLRTFARSSIKLSFRRKKITPPPQKKEVVMATP